MSSVLPTGSISGMSTDEKLRAIQNVKGETEALRQRIVYTKQQIMDTTLPQVATNTPPLGDVKIRGRNNFKGHVGKVYSMKLTHDDKYLVSAAQDGFVLVWDALTTSKVEAIQLGNPWVLACGTSTDNQIIATGGLDNVCTLYPFSQRDGGAGSNTRHGRKRANISPRTPLAILKGHRGFLSHIEFLEPTKLATASADMSIITWDVSRGEKLQEYGDHLGDVNSISQQAQDRNMIASGSSDNTVKIWDLRVSPAKAQQTFTAMSTEVNSVHFFPDGNAVGAGCEDGTCRLFDLRSDCQIANYNDANEYNSPVSCVRFTPSGRLLITGFQDGSCGAWDILKSTWISQVPGHSGAITSVQVSSDGHRLYSSSWDSTLRAWEP